MTPEQDKLLREIEQDEHRLAARWNDPPSPNVEQIKQRVRLALGETWVEPQFDNVAPRATLAGQTKAKVRAELLRLRAESRTTEPPRRARLRVQLFRWTGGLAAAAALALAFVAWQSPLPGELTLAYADAFEAYKSADEFRTEFALLEDDLDELELMELGLSWDELHETLIDDVDNSIDDLLLDTELDDDLLGAARRPTGRDAPSSLG